MITPNVLDSVGFHPLIKQWFKTRFAAPSPPQQAGWPSIAAGHHTLIMAPTGSGKTLAAFLWSLDQLFRQSLRPAGRQFSENASGVHTLYISPLKALNNDIHQNLKAPLEEIRLLAANRGLQAPPIRAAVRTGDTPAHVRRSMLHQPPHILITTPESLYLLLSSRRGRELFRGLQYVIVDEIHALSANKRGVHLSLSLERMMALTQTGPVRIGLSATQKPLDRIAAFLGGQTGGGSTAPAVPRPVNIIDCGQRKDIDLAVATPVETFGELPESSVWQPVYRHLYKLIRAHATTLIFAGMRAQTEKIARALNQMHRQITGEPEAELALAHHGSISREARYHIEARLKAGRIPAVIATASLELGIDIGSVDLVVHLEAPRSVSGALQRVGRSGHLLSATRKGRIIVLYPADLDDAVAIARCMLAADIEETRIPENALDVLAQQIVAEVAAADWNYDDLYHLVRRSYCYRNLPRSAFKSVVEMLCGRFADLPLQALQARINWDRVNNQLKPRRGSRLAAVLNGGTIPDRGYYGVFLENANVKLGEVEEEFAFEARVGEVFFLGNSEWRIQKILQDRLIVSPVAAINPKAPFWKGGTLRRDFSTSIKIGQFRRKLLQKIDRGRAANWLREKCAVDENTARNLVAYITRQRTKGQLIATDQQVVAEVTIDRGGQPLLIIHATFGARVNGAWAIALAAVLEQQYHTQFQYSFDDDGILIRLPETTEPMPLDQLFKISSRRLEAHLIRALPRSAVFVAHFRNNAARSLMLPRSQPGKRIPLWLQRLRAADLLQAVGSREEFPVVMETYRECLQDVLDLAALKKVVDGILAGRIRCTLISTASPSPMAAGILFKFVSVYLYETDQSRQPGESLGVGNEFLATMLERSQVPAILNAELVLQAERRWQHLDPYFQAATVEDLFSIIEKLGPLDEESLQRRCKVDPTPWLNELKRDHRIILSTQHPQDRSKRVWCLKPTAPAVSEGDRDPAQVSENVRRYLRSRGPVTIAEIAADLASAPDVISDALARMLEARQVVRGRLMPGPDETQWCDPHNFTQLYRTAIARRRTVQNPADRMAFNRFLLKWHCVAQPAQPLPEMIQRYAGCRFPLHFFEREILRSRCSGSQACSLTDRLAEMEALISSGEIIVHAGTSGETGRRYVEWRTRGQGNLFDEPAVLHDLTRDLSPSGKIVHDFLLANGASYGRDLELGTGLGDSALGQALQELTVKGLASCENYTSFLSTLAPRPGRKTHRKTAVPPYTEAGAGLPPRRRWRSTKSDIRHLLRQRSRIQDGRWFLTTSFAVRGKAVDNNQRADWQARLLLRRYGILVKEWYRREQGLLPWFHIFQALKRLEWQGEIRRGYFVAGLSGVQFALAEALELLESAASLPSGADDPPALLSSLDPALPFGGGVDWGLGRPDGSPLKVVRSASNHLVLAGGRVTLYSENFFQRLTLLKDPPRSTWPFVVKTIKTYLKMPYPLKPFGRLAIHQIDDRPAAASPAAEELIKNGFEKDGAKLVLWPSAI